MITERSHHASPARFLSLLFLFFFLSLFFALLPPAIPCQAAGTALQGIYELACSGEEGFVLDVRSCTASEEELSGDVLQMYRSLDVNQQKFYLENLTATHFRVSCLASGMFLTANEDGTLSIAQAPADSENDKIPDTQTWLIRQSPDGYFYLQSALGGYLTLGDTRAYNGTPLTLQDYTGESNQKWNLQAASISGQDHADTDLIDPFAPGGQYETCSLSMWFGNSKETLTAQEIASWITETEDHALTSPEDGFTAYAQSLAEKYDTQGIPRNFRTSYGNTITLYQGDFGWKLDVEETAAVLYESAQSRTPHFVKPVWSKKGGSLNRGDDIGDSYIEIDLENQKVWLYVDGEEILETDCVSGTPGTDRETPGGVYSIFYMQSPAVLRGADYASPVDYWMAFNGNIGLHDADWQTSFGGDVYLTNGSHGCVNLPIPAAKKIYETVSIGFPVVCYK